MEKKELTSEERNILLQLARRSIEMAERNHTPPIEIPLEDYSPTLQEFGASFVTLTKKNGGLRGCIGALEAYQPLVIDVAEHAVAAAFEDYRFPPVRQDEIPGLHIEISRLTTPIALVYQNPEELLEFLIPGKHGVILRDGSRRATFLPQVWSSLPDKATFLSHLCQKMGAEPDLWRRKTLNIALYEVEEFEEE